MTRTLWRSVTGSRLCLCLKELLRQEKQEGFTAGQLHTQLVPAHPSPRPQARTTALMSRQVEVLREFRYPAPPTSASNMAVELDSM